MFILFITVILIVSLTANKKFPELKEIGRVNNNY